MAVQIAKFFGMFDKLDDLVYEPVHLVCDALRQPLKNKEAANRRQDKELEARLVRETEAFVVEMGLKKKQGEAEIELNTRQRQAEIESMIADMELARNARIVEAVKKYQEDLGKVSAVLLASIGSMQLELRDKAQALCLKKTREYKALQDEAMGQMVSRMEEIEQKFAEGRARTMMQDRVMEQNASIVNRADEFISMLAKDMEQLAQNFNAIAEQSAATTNRLLSPMQVREITGELRQSTSREIAGGLPQRMEAIDITPEKLT